MAPCCAPSGPRKVTSPHHIMFPHPPGAPSTAQQPSVSGSLFVTTKLFLVGRGVDDDQEVKTRDHLLLPLPPHLSSVQRSYTHHITPVETFRMSSPPAAEMEPAVSYTSPSHAGARHLSSAEGAVSAGSATSSHFQRRKRRHEGRRRSFSARHACKRRLCLC